MDRSQTLRVVIVDAERRASINVVREERRFCRRRASARGQAVRTGRA
jgi:hypothetical protein